MLTITVAVGLLPLVSTTVDAADYEMPYIIRIIDSTAGTDRIYVSDGAFYPIRGAGSGTNGIDAMNGSNCVEIAYSTVLDAWETVEIKAFTSHSQTWYDWSRETTFFTGRQSYANISSNTTYSDLQVYTNCSWPSGSTSKLKKYSNDLSSLPQGLTEDVIRDIIDEQLNTQTAAGQTAQTIINNTTNQYNLYLAGDIDSTTMQQNVKSNIDTLSDLTPSTLLDAMQINNGLTYNQTIQDQLLNTASGNVQTMINGYQNTINSAITNYQNGTTSQQDTVNIINQAITNLNNMIINGTASTTADVNAVNAAINAANANLDSVTGYKDVSQEASDKSQKSDQAELDYLEELTAETTSTVEQLAPSKNFTSGQTGEAQEVLDLIWENEFVKRLLPMCAGFMVVCVVLGIRYKV